MLAGLEDSEYGRAHAGELLEAAGCRAGSARATRLAASLPGPSPGADLAKWLASEDAEPGADTAARRARSKDLAGVWAPARLDRRTKNLTKRLKPGDIAIIDHADLDRVAADALLRCQVAGVVNVAPSITGRYPNLGPQLLLDGGIPLVDDVGPDVFDQVKEGQQVRLDGDTLYVGDVVVAKGTRQTAETVAADVAAAKEGLAEQLRSFVTNTLRVHRPRSRAAGRGHQDPRAAHPARRAARSRRGPRLPLSRGPAGAARLHPGVQAGHDRRGRRRRRTDRGGLPAADDRRRHGLGFRQGTELRGRDCRGGLSQWLRAGAAARAGPRP